MSVAGDLCYGFEVPDDVVEVGRSLADEDIGSLWVVGVGDPNGMDDSLACDDLYECELGRPFGFGERPAFIS